MEQEAMHSAEPMEDAPDRTVEEGQEELPKRILYEMPEEMRAQAPDTAESEAVAQVQETPEPGLTPPAPPVEYGDDVRPDALHLEGDPISQLSTSRLLAFVAYSGSQAKGIEWINDKRCILAFESYGDALRGLEQITYRTGDGEMNEKTSMPAPSVIAMQDPSALSPSETEALVRPRLAMAFPSALYTPVEKQAMDALPEALRALDEARNRLAQNADDAPDIYKEMELEELEKKHFTPELRELQRVRQSLWIRFALRKHDTKAPRSAQRSNWYRQHGRGAGKEVVPRLLQVGDRAGPRRRRGEKGELFFARDDIPDPYLNPRSDRDWQEDYTPRSLQDRIGRRRGHDWDDDNAQKRLRSLSASPDHSTDGELRIRGRGSIRAPNARMAGWDD